MQGETWVNREMGFETNQWCQWHRQCAGDSYLHELDGNQLNGCKLVLYVEYGRTIENHLTVAYVHNTWFLTYSNSDSANFTALWLLFSMRTSLCDTSPHDLHGKWEPKWRHHSFANHVLANFVHIRHGEAVVYTRNQSIEITILR